jgi:hypothetical protein
MPLPLLFGFSGAYEKKGTCLEALRMTPCGVNQPVGDVRKLIIILSLLKTLFHETVGYTRRHPGKRTRNYTC